MLIPFGMKSFPHIIVFYINKKNAKECVLFYDKSAMSFCCKKYMNSDNLKKWFICGSNFTLFPSNSEYIN